MIDVITTASDIALEVAKKTDNETLLQLNEHISRGLIVIEREQHRFVIDMNNPGQIELKMSVKLKLKEQEYIESLEKKLEAIKLHMKHPSKDLNWFYYLEQELLK